MEGILRTEHGSAGQTELKLWLAELSRADGTPPISRQRATTERPAEKSDVLIEGNSVQLRDDIEDAGGGLHDDGPSLGNLEGRDKRERSGARGTAPTVAFKVDGGGSAPKRLTGVEATALTDLSLTVVVALAAIVLAGGGYAVWRTFGRSLANAKAALEQQQQEGPVYPETVPDAAREKDEADEKVSGREEKTGGREREPAGRERDRDRDRDREKDRRDPPARPGAQAPKQAAPGTSPPSFKPDPNVSAPPVQTAPPAQEPPPPAPPPAQEPTPAAPPAQEPAPAAPPPAQETPPAGAAGQQ